MVDSGIFRVKIDLGRFYTDHKSKAYVSVNRQWKNVRQFHRHISEMFDVKRFVLLTSDGVYLPAKEHIGIIQSGDFIRVTPKNDDNESTISENSETLMRTLTERNVNEHSRSRDIRTQNAMSSVSTSIEIISPKKSNAGGGDDTTATNDTNSTGSKRKRVRHRKKKKDVTGNVENQHPVSSVESQNSKIQLNKPGPSALRNPFSTPKSNTHVRFEDDESLSELDEVIALPKRARIITAEIKGIVDYGVLKVDAGSKVNADRKSAMDQEVPKLNDVIPIQLSENELNGNGGDKSTAIERTESALEQLAKNTEEIDKYNDMKDDAKEMDMIAFKVFTPNFEMSGYVIGLIEKIIGNVSINQDYDLVILIMAGNSNIEHLKDDNHSEEGEDGQTRIQINRMDIFQAKIVTL